MAFPWLGNQRNRFAYPGNTAVGKDHLQTNLNLFREVGSEAVPEKGIYMQGVLLSGDVAVPKIPEPISCFPPGIIGKLDGSAGHKAHNLVVVTIGKIGLAGIGGSGIPEQQFHGANHDYQQKGNYSHDLLHYGFIIYR
jgi:hypothetical protein